MFIGTAINSFGLYVTMIVLISSDLTSFSVVTLIATILLLIGRNDTCQHFSSN